MATPAKFLFDVDFGSPVRPQKPEQPREQMLTQAEVAVMVANAEARAYRDGFDAGQKEAKAENDRRNAIALEEISVSMKGIVRNFAGIEQRMETEAVDIAVAIARKLCSELIAAEPLTEIMTLVTDCFRQLVAVPHIVIRLNDALYEEANERIQRAAMQNGFQGKLVILAEPEIPAGDCRIEWADGGMRLERGATEAKINELVGRYMAARHNSGLPRL